MASETEELLDLQQAAKLLKVSARNVRRLAACGELPFHRVGRQLRFDREEVLSATRGKPVRSA